MHSLTLRTTAGSQRQPCYFSITPASYNHHSVETPAASPTFCSGETPADPYNPLLAYRAPETLVEPTSPRMNTSSIMQLQSSAAHSQTATRPKPYPVQNVLHVTSDDSESSSSSSSSSTSSPPPPELMRCSRCQRAPSMNSQTGKSNMIQFGLNSFYCTRCAGMVGYTQR